MLRTLTLTGPAYPTHDTPFEDGWYIVDTTATGFLSDTYDTFDHLVGRGSERPERVIEETDSVGEKSVEFISHDNQYWVQEDWDLEKLFSFEDYYFTYKDEFIFQPFHQSAYTGSLEELTGNNQYGGKVVVKKFGHPGEELLILDQEDITAAVENDQIKRLQSANQFEQF